MLSLNKDIIQLIVDKHGLDYPNFIDNLCLVCSSLRLSVLSIVEYVRNVNSSNNHLIGMMSGISNLRSSIIWDIRRVNLDYNIHHLLKYVRKNIVVGHLILDIPDIELKDKYFEDRSTQFSINLDEITLIGHRVDNSGYEMTYSGNVRRFDIDLSRYHGLSKIRLENIYVNIYPRLFNLRTLHLVGISDFRSNVNVLNLDKLIIENVRGYPILISDSLKIVNIINSEIMIENAPNLVSMSGNRSEICVITACVLSSLKCLTLVHPRIFTVESRKYPSLENLDITCGNIHIGTENMDYYPKYDNHLGLIRVLKDVRCDILATTDNIFVFDTKSNISCKTHDGRVLSWNNS